MFFDYSLIKRPDQSLCEWSACWFAHLCKTLLNLYNPQLGLALPSMLIYSWACGSLESEGRKIHSGSQNCIELGEPKGTDLPECQSVCPSEETK